MTLYDHRLPYNGKRANKDSLTTTLPHFRFQTKATTDKGEQIRNKVFGVLLVNLVQEAK